MAVVTDQHGAASRPEATQKSLAIAQPFQIAAASLSAAAGIIHLVMAPSHMGESAIEGTGFLVAGWLQLAFAAAFLLMRLSRPILLSAIAVNAGIVAAWAISRTTGLPFGSHEWHAENITFIDAASVAFEASVIALAAILLIRPTVQLSASASQVLGAAVPIIVLAITTAALASPSARDHASGAHGMHGHADDKGLSLLTNGHHAAMDPQPLDADTQTTLDGQLAISKQVAERYPTVADAEAAGYRRAGPYGPGLGAHYISYGGSAFNADGVMNEDDLSHPLAIIYDGTAPDSKVAGFMYYSMSATEPQGFAGPNDIWHYHERICIKYGPSGVEAPFGADFDATDAQCAAAGGSILPITQWMVHVWSVPGYDNVDGGAFAEVNPALKCSDGTYYQLPPDEWAANPLNVCRSGTGSVTSAG
jgi:hypothetical protein